MSYKGLKVDYTGQRFGRALVLSFVGRNARHAAVWRCQCDCGTIFETRGDALHRGDTKSCGCLQAEIRQRAAALFRLPYGEAAFNELFRGYGRSAKARNIEFNLTADQFRDLTGMPCYYCGMPPDARAKFGRCNGNYIYNGVDRVDNTKGYDIDNVRPCCKRCNYFKGKLVEADFFDQIRHAMRIIKHMGIDTDT